MENNNKIEICVEKICKRCSVSNKSAKFGVNRLVCIKCCSTQNNERLKHKNYYKDYYKEHKDKFIEKSLDYYNRVVKPSKLVEKKVGRPKKVVNV